MQVVILESFWKIHECNNESTKASANTSLKAMTTQFTIVLVLRSYIL